MFINVNLKLKQHYHLPVISINYEELHVEYYSFTNSLLWTLLSYFLTCVCIVVLHISYKCLYMQFPSRIEIFLQYKFNVQSSITGYKDKLSYLYYTAVQYFDLTTHQYIETTR